MDERILLIDENALDKEWLRQPKLFFEHAHDLADQRDIYERKKRSLELERANLDKAIRDDPEAFGLTKLTENLVTNTIIRQESFIQKQDKLNEAKYELDLAQAIVTSLDQKKAALENLVRLHGQNYFSTPSGKGLGKEVAEDIEKKAARTKKRRKRLK